MVRNRSGGRSMSWTGCGAVLRRAWSLRVTCQVAAFSIRSRRQEPEDDNREKDDTREREQTEKSKADLRGLHAGIESSSADTLEFALGMRIPIKATQSNGSGRTKIIQLAYGSETLRRRNWRLAWWRGCTGRTMMPLSVSQTVVAPEADQDRKSPLKSPV